MRVLLFRLRFWRDHRWAPSQMSAYLEGELPVPGRERMRRHLGVCNGCRTGLGGLRLVVDALRLLPPPEGGIGATQLAAAVRARLSEPPAS